MIELTSEVRCSFNGGEKRRELGSAAVQLEESSLAGSEVGWVESEVGILVMTLNNSLARHDYQDIKISCSQGASISPQHPTRIA